MALVIGIGIASAATYELKKEDLPPSLRKNLVDCGRWTQFYNPEGIDYFVPMPIQENYYSCNIRNTHYFGYMYGWRDSPV